MSDEPRRLVGWKEIAEYLGVQAARTAQRYEKGEGLPIHRHHHEKRPTPWAWAHELDLWLASRESDQPAATRKTSRRKRVAIAVLVTMAIGIALFAWSGFNGPAEKRVWIPPFEVSGDTTGSDYLGIAFAGAIISNLAIDPDLQTLSAHRHTNADVEVPLVERARQQQATLFLDGQLTINGEDLELHLQLIEPASQTEKWSTTQTLTRSDIPMMASLISSRILEVLESREPPQFEYFRYVTGSATLNEDPSLPIIIGALRQHSVDVAMEATAKLVARYPMEPAAHVIRMHALVDYVNAGLGGSIQEIEGRIAEVMAEFEQFDRVDPGNPNIPLYIAWVENQIRKDQQKAIDLCNEALLQSNITPALRAYGLRIQALAFRDSGDTARAQKNLTEAIRLDPTSVWSYSYLSSVLYRDGQYEAAAQRALEASALDPFSPWHAIQRARALEELEQTDEALAIYRTACGDPTQGNWTCISLAEALVDAGRMQEARQVASQVAESPETQTRMRVDAARILTVTNDHLGALQALELCVSEGFLLEDIEQDETLAALTKSEHYPEFLRRVTAQASQASH